jgi:hypothetical protein
MTSQRAAVSRDHRELPFAGLAVEVEHHPIPCLSGAVRPGGIREQGGVATRTAARVKYRKPRLARRIEPARRDEAQLPRGSLLAILPIDIEQFDDARGPPVAG